MAKVYTGVLGGNFKELEVRTVSEAKRLLGLEGNYVATVNGDTVNDDSPLADYEVLTFAAAVKGGIS